MNATPLPYGLPCLQCGEMLMAISNAITCLNHQCKGFLTLVGTMDNLHTLRAKYRLLQVPHTASLSMSED